MQCVIIGLEYSESVDENIKRLNGVSSDIYKLYKWCIKFCKQDNIHIITDISEINPDKDNILKKKLDTGRIEPEIITFMEHHDNVHIIKTDTDLIKAFDKLQYHYTKYFLFYVGHGKDGSICMPSGKNLPMLDLKSNFVSRTPVGSYIFWILDCCYPSNLNLPFKFVDNEFIYNSNCKEISLCDRNILLLNSCSENQKNKSSQDGSVFLEAFIRYMEKIYLKDKIIQDISFYYKYNRNLQTMCKTILSIIGDISRSKYLPDLEDRDISIYSSVYMDPILWLWIGNNKNTDIIADLFNNNLYIKDKLKRLV